MSSRTTDFRLLTVAACVATLLPRLAHRGMFLDGVTYASIARNLADGRGRFWEPFYTATLYPAFHEHPPLGFFLQSLWFRVLGDRWFVERLYCAACAAATAVLIGVTWRSVRSGRRDITEPVNPPLTLSPSKGERLASAATGGDDEGNAWLPIAMWMAVPVVSWVIVGNLLETTVAVFVAAAVAALATTSRTSVAVAIGGGLVSGLCVAGAVLSKGPVGLFPMAAPPLLALLRDRRHRIWWSLAAQWVAVAGCGLALFAAPGARESLVHYVNDQVLNALAGRREVSGSSTTILVTLVEGVWLPMLVLGGLMAALARTWTPPSADDRRTAAVFVLIGLSGTLPIMVSPKQMGHYLMPAVAFYAIGAAALVAPTMRSVTGRRSETRGVTFSRIVAGLLLAGSIAAIWIPALEREPDRLAQLDRLEAVAPRGATVGICPAVNGDWSLHAWFQRRFRISLDAAGAHEWFLETRGDSPNCAPSHCVAASPPLDGLTLMRCQ